MRVLGWKPALTQISVAHARPIAEHVRLAPENPVFILSGTTP
jgi:precorrin-6B methylase 2